MSGGGGFSIFGIEIAEAQVSALAGVTLTQESTTTATTETKWGIELSKGWGPHISSATGSVKSYEFRLFFLPVPSGLSTLPPNYWAQELINNIPNGTADGQKIDTSSCCWRIVFVVTAIEYNDPNQPSYQYDGGLDESSVYPVSPTPAES